ncbi:alcohol oxidase-3 [Coleophoma cylindrospora]|uniref:Alcohol oxidase-3 n=1 Tax=Coleophoma cylindrospora TaxID=1849047 RepID=A0A3D8QVW5_9HELO|nr:alcohol oxidase-3 [Coleophoma cylindrospora]
MLSFLSLVAALSALQTAHAATSRGGQTILFSNHFGIPGENATYDYVIIGGGTAGLALATRLAENEALSVAVIEAGDFYEKDHGNRSVVPAYGFMYGGATTAASVHSAPLVDWAFLTTPQPALGNTTYHVPRGRCLGGSSARNFMVYHRGTTGSYGQWADMVGDDSYKFSNLLCYFKKSAKYTKPDTQIRAANATVPNPNSTAFSSSGGPLQVSHAHFALPFSSFALSAFEEVGIPEVEDLNSGDLLGAQYSTTTTNPEDQTRSSSESSYLQAAFVSRRTNLQIYPQTMAKQILFDQNKTATGVRVVSHGAEYILSAKREVVLSGGAYSSPQILMVSGVGPKDTLAKYNIPVVANRPGVGQNLWDHMLFAVIHEVDVATQSQLSDPTYKTQAEQEYIHNGTGILTNMGADFLAFEKLPKENRANLTTSSQKALTSFAADWPEVEYIMSSFTFAGGAPGKNYAEIFAALVAPLSRGSVTIQSNDTAIQPVIDPGWFSNPADLDVAVQAFHRTRALWATKALSGVKIGAELVPGPSVQTDAEIAAYILGFGSSVYHPACTCKMGKRDDPMAVVDSKAKVIGVHGLRVVDASAFPLLPPGHPQSTIYALAEKIAAEILRDLK